MPEGFAYLITCEHASRFIPHRYRRFPGPRICRRPAHEQWDPGAAVLAREMARLLRAPYFPGTVNRLLVELNRSLTHRELFSPYSQSLPENQRSRLLLDYYYPYRYAVMHQLEALLAENLTVVHLSIHTFAPRLRGEVRRTDFGLLFDPLIPREKSLSEMWLEQIHREDPQLRVRANYPYLGTADGHVPLLRRITRRAPYLGFELEFNQALGQQKEWENIAPELARLVTGSLRQCLRRKSARRLLR